MKNLAIGSTVIVCENVLMNKKNQMIFGSANAQLQYFMQRAKVSVTNATYIRADSYFNGTIRIPALYQNVCNCDYLTFTNPSGKRFYAVVNGASYIDVTTTEISFTVDMFQTYMFDFKLEQQDLVRAMVKGERVGDNTEPESQPFDDSMEYVFNKEIHNFKDELVIMCYIRPRLALSMGGETHPSDPPTGLTTFNGLTYGGWILLYPYTTAGLTAFNKNINSVDFLVSNEIDGIYIVPNINRAFFRNQIPDDGVVWTWTEVMFDNVQSATFTYQLPIADVLGNLKNKKCLQAPFTTFKVGTVGNWTPDLDLGHVKNNGTNFEIKVTCSLELQPYPRLRIWVADYNIKDGGVNEDYQVVIDCPQVSNTQTGNWLPSLMQILKAPLNVPSVLGALQVEQHRVGQTQAGGFGVGLCIANYSIMFLLSQSHDIGRWDNYFSHYGYAQNVQLITGWNIYMRQNWDYVQFNNANITGKIPQKAKDEIADIFNNGVTLWYNDIYNYNRDNPDRG